MGDNIKVCSGTHLFEGTKTDGMGQLHGTWGGLAVIPDEDDFEILR